MPMKVYVISDKTGYAVTAANHINEAGSEGVISEQDNQDTRSMLEDVKAGINSNFDVVVVIWADVKKVAIAANRFSGIKAVVCKDAEDVSDAINDVEANVLMFDSDKIAKRQLDVLVTAMLSADKEPRRPSAVQKATPRQVVQQDRNLEPKGSILDSFKSAAASVTSKASSKAASITQKNGQEEEAAEPRDRDEASFVGSAKRKGLGNALKEAFGIEDAEDGDQDAAGKRKQKRGKDEDED